MPLIADLHVHSRYSMATSRQLDLAALHRGACRKGLDLVGTGDFTHPGWFAELGEHLEATGGDLFVLREEERARAEDGLPEPLRRRVHFVLQTEISCVHRREGRTRRTHSLVFVPTLEAAERLACTLAAFGRLDADGRPTLKLDTRELLGHVLDSDPRAFLVPAHIWTPWYSVFGSRSGFDSLGECFGDLSGEIFAVETGLSSDPPMNWRIGELASRLLISCSDAHSAAKLGREATLLDIEASYDALLAALRSGVGLEGTLEFHPEEGKYHHDGHRKCSVRLHPEESRRLGGRCPRCGQPVTAGVLARVLELADRDAAYRPPNARRYETLVALPTLLAEVHGVGVNTRTVQRALLALADSLGAELSILREAPLTDIARVGGARLADAVRCVRAGELVVEPGYDGHFGTVRTPAH